VSEYISVEYEGARWTAWQATEDGSCSCRGTETPYAAGDWLLIAPAVVGRGIMRAVVKSADFRRVIRSVS
jgi:hypothetical protein